MSKKRKFPPLWALPALLTSVPRMVWAQRKGDYIEAMRIGRSVMGSAKIKRRAYKGYIPTKHDVFVCAYSKSGTYWMMQVVTQIAGKGSIEFNHIHDLVPWPETPAPGLARLSDPTWQGTVTQKRAIKTHAEGEFVPYNKQAQYVVVVRDPKDAFVSGFYFSDSIMPGLKSIGLENWVDISIKGETPYGSWSVHLHSYWSWRDRPNVLLVTFGEMKQDLEKVVRRLANMMKVTLTNDEVATILKKSSFAYMKSMEEKFEPPVPIPNNTVEILRQGKKGDGKRDLSAEQVGRVDQEMKAQLQALGSDFPYDDYFG